MYKDKWFDMYKESVKNKLYTETKIKS